VSCIQKPKQLAKSKGRRDHKINDCYAFQMKFKLKLLLLQLLQLLVVAAGQPEFEASSHHLTKRMDLESCIGKIEII